MFAAGFRNYSCKRQVPPNHSIEAFAFRLILTGAMPKVIKMAKKDEKASEISGKMQGNVLKKLKEKTSHYQQLLVKFHWLKHKRNNRFHQGQH